MALRRIALRDFVIVRALELDLAAGFTVLTGETGAGKSILIDALQLALGNRAEFALVFTNVDVDCLSDLTSSASTGMRFSELLFALWEKNHFPTPALGDLDPELAEILRDPQVPADLTNVPEELRGLVWVLQRAWSRLYGTVTLEVFGHIDPRMVEQGHLFRAMVTDQAGPLGLEPELPRLTTLLDELLGSA